MKTILFLFRNLLIGIVLFAFVPLAGSLEKAVAPKSGVKKSPAIEKETGKAEWEVILKKAQKEGEVAIVGGTSVGGLRESVRPFKEKFGINLLITTGRGSSVATKIMEERRGGLYLQDVMISGQSTMIEQLKPSGAFDPLTSMLVLPEVVDQKLWYDGRFDWADEGRYIFNFALYPTHLVVINTDLVSPGEIQSYYDLLNPKWKDKLLINDPTTSGMGNSGFTAMVYNSMVTLDFLRQLAAQKNMMTRDQDLLANWLSKGKYPIALWPSLGGLSRYIEAGAPVRPVINIKEGASAGAAGCAMSVFNRAPHPNAAKVFINWFLSREGQAINQKGVRKQTRRIDVSSEGLLPFEIRIPGVKYFPKPDEKEHFVLNEAKKADKLAEQIFSALK